MILLGIAALVRDSIWALAAVGVVAVAVNFWFVAFQRKARSHLLKLRARLESD